MRSLRWQLSQSCLKEKDTQLCFREFPQALTGTFPLAHVCCLDLLRKIVSHSTWPSLKRWGWQSAAGSQPSCGQNSGTGLGCWSGTQVNLRYQGNPIMYYFIPILWQLTPAQQPSGAALVEITRDDSLKQLGMFNFWRCQHLGFVLHEL